MKRYMKRITGLLLILSAAALLYAQPGVETYEVLPYEEAVPESFDTEAGELTADYGVVITAVISDGAADRAGLRRGDVITEVDGMSVSSLQDILSAVETKYPGDTVTVTFQRAQSSSSVELQLDQRDGWPLVGIYGVGAYDHGRMGYGNPLQMHRMYDQRQDFRQFEYMHRRLPQETADALSAGDASRVVRVDAAGSAAEAGIEPGILIFEVSGDALADGDLAGIIASYEPGQRITLTGFDGREIREYTVTLGERDGKALLGLSYVPAGAGYGHMHGGNLPHGGTAPRQRFAPRGMNSVDPRMNRY